MRTQHVLLGIATAMLASGGKLHSQASLTGAAITGTAFDSLTMTPVSGALVWIAGSNLSARTDASGRFRLENVAAGRHFVAFSAPTLDSLGFETLGKTVNVEAGREHSVSLTTPSFATVWRASCGSQAIPPGAGILWGTIKDADGDVRLAGARTTVEWQELTAERKQVSQMSRTHTALSDVSGTYYACGVPAGSNVVLQAQGARSSTGIIEQRMPAHGLLRVDLLVSGELQLQSQLQVATRDSAPAVSQPVKGTASLKGRVLDDQQRAVSGALVTMATSQSTVRTDADGRFLLLDVPAGSQMIEVRYVGAAPVAQSVSLVPRSTTEVVVSLPRVTELEAVNIREEQFTARDRLDFEYRKRAGFGYRIEESQFQHAATMASVLQFMPGMNVTTRRDGTLNLSPIRSSVSSRANVTVWVDGVLSSLEELSSIHPRNLRAIEWYPRVTTAPAKYVGIQANPILLVWTHQARWGDRRPH